ncbi:MAG: hypothetical protein ABTA16_00735 [Niallia sp.]
MDEEVLKKTIYKLSQRIAGLTVDLDLAYSQIDLLKVELKNVTEKKKEIKN